MNLGPLSLWPAAFWLLVPILLTLLLLRLYQSRRQEITAGSLMLWRRLAAQQPRTPPPRVWIDRTLILQLLAFFALVLAFTAPVLGKSSRGRVMLLVVDNGPLARARSSNKEPLWIAVKAEALSVLNELKSDDRVYLAVSAPGPRLLSDEGLAPAAAIAMLGKISPALSGPQPERLLAAAIEIGARMEKTGGAAAPPLILSLRAAPPSGAQHWRCVASSPAPANTAIVAVGAVPIGSETMQVMVRLRHFSNAPATGSVRLSAADKILAEQALQLPPDADQAVVLTVPYPMQSALRIAWTSSDKNPDALPEDDVVMAAPRTLTPPRIRLHAPLPALEKLYAAALNATILNSLPEPESTATTRVDLEIYANSVPEQAPAHCGAMLFLAPERGYRSVFDSGKLLPRPRPQLDEKDSLTAGLADGPDGIFPIAEAREILQTGDFKTVLKDRITQRALVARFVDERGAPGFLMAFVPGAGMPSERPLDPALAAMLVRIALEAAGSREPLELRRAAELEAESRSALPLNWMPDQEKSAGVLDESVSHLQPGQRSNTAALPLVALSHGRVYDLSPWFILVALLLLAAELWLSRTARAGLASKTN